jgi:hypothetical protein
MWFAPWRARSDIVVQRSLVRFSLEKVGDEYIWSLGKEDLDATIEGFVKVRAYQEAVGDIPSHVDVIRYLTWVPYLYVITQMPSHFNLHAEVGSLSSSRVVAESACPIAHLDSSTRIRLRCGLGSVVVIVCQDGKPG